MGDHFVLLVDRLITEATLEAAIESRNRMMQASTLAANDDDDAKNVDKSFTKLDFADLSSPGKIFECRICHDEDPGSNMESPCSCSGSLKYAHRRCVQRWCNEKGDTICEICKQPFKPGYTAPPPLFQLGHIPLNFRGNWGISRRGLTDPRIITVVPPDHDFLDTDYEEYTVSSTRTLPSCRTLAVIFVFLLILRHSLPIILSGSYENFLPLFTLLLLRTAGIILPIYIIAKAIATCHHHRHHPNLQESADLSIASSSDEESENSMQPQPYIIHIQ